MCYCYWDMVVTDTRPIILTTFNPLSDSPLMALWPEPMGSMGWRVWQLIGGTKEDYIRAWDRRNLLDAAVWDYDAVRECYGGVWHKTEGRHVILLGTQVRNNLRLPKGPWILPTFDNCGREWRVVPVPGGREYRDPTMSLRVSLLLQDFQLNYGGLGGKK